MFSVKSFQAALAVEEIHHGLYRGALDAVKGGGDLPAGFADAHLNIPSFGGDNLAWTLGQAVTCWVDDRNVPSDVMFHGSGSGPPNLFTGPEVVVSTPNLDHLWSWFGSCYRRCRPLRRASRANPSRRRVVGRASPRRAAL